MKKTIFIFFLSLSLAYSQTPDWNIESGDFQMHSNLVALVKLNTIEIGNSNDLLAAFSGNELRGVVSPNNISGKYAFFLVIHSNSNSENIEFKYWDSIAGEIRMISESITFVESAILGSAISPIEFNAYENFDFTPLLTGIPDQTIELGESFNSIDLENYTTLEDLDEVKYSFIDAISFSISIENSILNVSPNDNQWIGSEDILIEITDISTAELFSIDTIRFTVSEQSLPPILDDVPGQIAYFNEDFSNINLVDYLTSQGNDEIIWNYRLISNVQSENSPNWLLDPGAFAFQMNIVVRVLSRNNKIDDGNHLLGAFNGDELSGVASPINIAGEYLFFLTVYSNTFNDTISFQFYDDYFKETLPIYEKTVFSSNVVLGSSANPVELGAGRLVLEIDDQANVTIHRVDSQWTGREDLEVYAIENTTERLADTAQTYVEVKEDLLPVELTSFTANFAKNKVLLKWQTATEVNNYGFEILSRFTPQRDNNSEHSEEIKIGFVEGHGNSNSPKQYSFSDEAIKNGKYSYRLKQIDTDGKFEYSELVEVEVNNLPTKFELSQNYPNPFNPETTIQFGLPVESKVNITIYNILGQRVSTLINKEVKAGYYLTKWNAEDDFGSKIASGVYIYRMFAKGKNNTFTETKKLMILK